ncbi:MAG: hypothetical protein FWG75_08235 [Cystobacterineae bacterium]|nr:hypothetical protein [Cystobacterineae bacterium]
MLLGLVEQVCCWLVREGHELNDRECFDLVESLDNINAVQECPAWKDIQLSPHPSLGTPGNRWRMAQQLFHRLLDAEDPRGILMAVVAATYQWDKPEKEKVLGVPIKSPDFFPKSFWPLYLDSLLLQEDKAREYCWANKYPQTHQLKGYPYRDNPSHSQPQRAAPPMKDNVVTRAAAAGEVKTGSNKDKPRIEATRKACEQVRQEIEHEVRQENAEQWRHMFLVNGVPKTNQNRFKQAVSALLDEIRPHRDTLRDEWKKVPKELVHNGRPPDQ